MVVLTVNEKQLGTSSPKKIHSEKGKECNLVCGDMVSHVQAREQEDVGSPVLQTGRGS